jgi:hypothetical protein
MALFVSSVAVFGAPLAAFGALIADFVTGGSMSPREHPANRPD